MSKKILVRLPNWLGDMVMSVGFMNQLPHFFPDAEVSVIAKKGIHELLPFFPPIKHSFIFSKEEYKGFGGLISFGRSIKKTELFDLYFCLPNSFSTALAGFATGADKRIGFKKELRQFLLTHSYPIPSSMHRVQEYIRLLELFTGKNAINVNVRLNHKIHKKDHVVVNINSEASSRRLTVAKAIEILNDLRNAIDNRIILIGAPKEKEFVEEVMSKMNNNKNVESIAGKTSLTQLVEWLASAQVMLSTDSGPAHLANALGTYTIVLFGAGNEKNTAPYNRDFKKVIRLGQLPCEPCLKNTCEIYGIPQCLERLPVLPIIENVKHHLDNGKIYF